MLQIPVPENVKLKVTSEGLCLVGEASAVAQVVAKFRDLGSMSSGTEVPFADWTLRISEDVPEESLNSTITMPAQAWFVAASVLIGACYGDYTNPFFLGEVGYLSPPPVPDIGVETVNA